MPGHTPCGRTRVGLLLLRSVKATAGKGKKLQMLLVDTYKDELTLPAGKPLPVENELAGAERVVREKLGLSADDYEVFENFAFVMRGTTHGDYQRVSYWLALLESDATIELGREYKSYSWIDFSEIKNNSVVALGRAKRGLEVGLGEFADKHGEKIHEKLEHDMELESDAYRDD